MGKTKLIFGVADFPAKISSCLFVVLEYSIQFFSWILVCSEVTEEYWKCDPIK